MKPQSKVRLGRKDNMFLPEVMPKSLPYKIAEGDKGMWLSSGLRNVCSLFSFVSWLVLIETSMSGGVHYKTCL